MYLITSLLILYVSYRLFRVTAGSMKFTELNMLSLIYYLQFFIFCFIGSILIVYNIDDHYTLRNLANDSIRVKGWLTVMYSMIAFPIGTIMAKMMFSRYLNNNLFDKFRIKNVVPTLSKHDSYIRLFLYFLTVCSFATYIYLLYIAKDVALLKLLRNTSVEELAVYRIMITRGFPGNQYVINILGLALTPLLSYIAYSYYVLTKSRKDIIWTTITGLLTILFLTYNLEKAPVLFYLIGFALLSVIMKGKISLRRITYIGSGALVVILFLYMLTSEFNPRLLELSFNEGILGHIFLTQIAGLYHFFEIFPNQHDYIGFASISRFLSDFLGINHSERAARITMEIMYPKLIELGIAGVFNSLFIGEAWANFGTLGLILSPFYVGFYVGSIYCLLLSLKKSPIVTGLYAYISVNTSITGGFNDFLYAPVLFVIIGLLLALYLFAIGLKESSAR